MSRDGLGAVEASLPTLQSLLPRSLADNRR